jgi:hypothetical protein
MIYGAGDGSDSTTAPAPGSFDSTGADAGDGSGSTTAPAPGSLMAPAPGAAVPHRGAGSTAQTVILPLEDRIPQVLDRCSTMARPRPPSEERDGCLAPGRVGAPPSLTDTRSEPLQSVQATRTVQPGNGCACRIALLSSSLKTKAASPIAAAIMPASRRSVASRPRAVATLDGAYGSRTTLAALTSPRPAPADRPDRTGHAPRIHPGNAHLPRLHHHAQAFTGFVT